jgi:hypothetical protein
VALFESRADGRKEGAAVPTIPEQPRPNNRACVVWKVGPSVVIDVTLLLPVAAGEHRQRPSARQRRRPPEDGVGRAEHRAIQQNFTDPIFRRMPRNQVDDSAHRAAAIQRGGNTFDDLNLSKINRGNLQQTKPAHLLAEQRQSVGQEPRVSATHSLDADARRTERGRRRLDAHTAHLVERHDDVTRRHQHLFFDLLAGEDLDAHRFILEALVGASSRNDHVFLDGRLRLELDDDGSGFAGTKLKLGARRGKSFLDDDHLSGACAER